MSQKDDNGNDQTENGEGLKERTDSQRVEIGVDLFEIVGELGVRTRCQRHANESGNQQNLGRHREEKVACELIVSADDAWNLSIEWAFTRMSSMRCIDASAGKRHVFI